MGVMIMSNWSGYGLQKFFILLMDDFGRNNSFLLLYSFIFERAFCHAL